MNTQTEMTRAGGAADVQSGRSQGPQTTLQPAVDICETAEGMILRADMPGVSKDRLNVRVEGHSLLVEGSIGIDPQLRMSALHADVRAAAFRRSFVLSNELETDKIVASLKDGVLTVRIPKRAALRPRRIEIAAE